MLSFMTAPKPAIDRVAAAPGGGSVALGHRPVRRGGDAHSPQAHSRPWQRFVWRVGLRRRPGRPMCASEECTESTRVILGYSKSQKQQVKCALGQDGFGACNTATADLLTAKAPTGAVTSPNHSDHPMPMPRPRVLV